MKKTINSAEELRQFALEHKMEIAVAVFDRMKKKYQNGGYRNVDEFAPDTDDTEDEIYNLLEKLSIEINEENYDSIIDDFGYCRDGEGGWFDEIYDIIINHPHYRMMKLNLQYPLPDTYEWKLYNAFGVQEITTDTATGQNISSKYIRRW